MPAMSEAARRRWTGAAVLAGYSLISFLYLGILPLIRGGPQYVGFGYDPQIFIWSFAWWPHAILHGLNPFVTHVVWSPAGVNLTWATTVPGLSLLFAPLTLLFGPIFAFDVAAVLMPALAAWAGYLLCRYLTHALWPSLVGGYLFGFSSYLIAQTGGGHLNLGSVFLFPLVALVVLRFLDGELGRRGLVVRLGPLIALQILFSTEVAFTLSLALAGALVLCFAVVPVRRRAVVASVLPLAVAYLLAMALTSPLLYYALSDFQRGAFYAPGSLTADLLNFVIPTKITAIGGGLFSSISHRFTGNLSEQGAYIGLPALLIVCLFARDRWRSPVGRFLIGCLALAVIVALGANATVEGRKTIPLPWSLIQNEPVFDNVLTARFAVYAWLVVAVMVALWTARRRAGTLRWLLPLLAVLAIVPDPHAGGFATSYRVPAFFTEQRLPVVPRPGIDHRAVPDPRRELAFVASRERVPLQDGRGRHRSGDPRVVLPASRCDSDHGRRPPRRRPGGERAHVSRGQERGEHRRRRGGGQQLGRRPRPDRRASRRRRRLPLQPLELPAVLRGALSGGISRRCSSSRRAVCRRGPSASARSSE